MAFPLIPTAAVVALLALAIYKFVIYPAYISPLSVIPCAHWSAPFSSLWILYHRQRQHDTPTIDALHKKLNRPILRLAPNELSVNCVEGGLRTIYAGGFEKGHWYSNVFSNYGVEPMFAMEGHREHALRKRMLSNVYAKSTLQMSEALNLQTEVLIRERLRPRLSEALGQAEGVEFYDIFCAVTMDFVSSYIFGLENGSDFIRDREAGVRLFHDFKARQKYTFWPQECPRLTRFLANLGLEWLVVPSWVNGANRDIEAWLMGMCDKAEETRKVLESNKEVDAKNMPTVYMQLETALKKEKSKDQLDDSDLRIEIASELLDHTLAGFDTSSITLTWLAWQLSKPANAAWQDLLRSEIASLGDSLDAKAIDALPILHAILMESLRLHAAIPGQQPRVTPCKSTNLGEPEAGHVYHNIPPNTRVQSQAYSLHRNPSVFPDPESWQPDRWLSRAANHGTYQARPSDELRDMTRHFWAFGSGGRMCVGSNLAMLDMKATIVGVWGNFKTEIVNDEGMVPNGGYMAEPLGIGKGGKKGIGGKYSADGQGRRFLRMKVTEVVAA